MADPDAFATVALRRTSDVPRERTCLRCKAPFESAWSGERICRRCKGTTSWRNGLPHAGPASGRQR